MAERQQFEMTEADMAELLEKIAAARRTSGMFLSGGIPMSNPQEAANSAWQALGKKMGFDGMSVRPVPGAGDRVFTAVPTV